VPPSGWDAEPAGRSGRRERVRDCRVLYHSVVSAFAAGHLEEARERQARAIALIRLLSRSQFMAASKALVSIVGIDCGPVRPPLRPLNGRETARLQEELEAIGFFDWLRAAKEG
jgi:N-acetylneuraminate lyase